MLLHHMALAVDGLGHRRGDAFHTHIVCGGSGVGEHSFHRLGGLPEQAVVDLDAVLEGVHHVGHDSTGGGQLARALAVEDHVAQHIALDEDGVEDVIDTGQLVCLRHEAGLDTGGNAAVLAPLHPGDELDDAAQLLCRSHIIHRDVADAAGGDVLGVDLVAADQRGQDGDLAAGVAAVHIVAGVPRLGVAQLLSDLQSLVKAQILPRHLGEHEVGGAVDDAFHLGDDVGREALVHRGDDGRAAAHGSLEQEGAAVCLGQSQQLCAVGGHHLLVGGADAPAALEAGLDVRVSEAGAADGLDDDLHFGVFQNGVKILYKQLCGRMIREVLGVKDVLDLHRFACAVGDACGVAAEHLVHAAAHRAKAQNRDFCHDTALVPFFYECTVTDCIRSVRPRPSAGAKAFPSAPRGSSAWCRCGW